MLIFLIILIPVIQGMVLYGIGSYLILKDEYINAVRAGFIIFVGVLLAIAGSEVSYIISSLFIFKNSEMLRQTLRILWIATVSISTIGVIGYGLLKMRASAAEEVAICPEN